MFPRPQTDENIVHDGGMGMMGSGQILCMHKSGRGAWQIMNGTMIIVGGGVKIAKKNYGAM